MRIDDSSIVVMVTGELAPAHRKMIEGLGKDVEVIEHVTTAHVSTVDPKSGGRAVIISRTDEP